MQLLASALLSFTAHAPAAPVDATLRVEVVDAAGKACVGVPVAIVIDRSMPSLPSRVDPETAKTMRRNGDFLSAWITAADSGPDGIASFDLAKLALAPAEFERCQARLALPLLDPIAVVFDPKQPPAAPLRLVRPACGSVRMEVPGIAEGSIRVRAFDADHSSPWGEQKLDRCAIVDGVATLPCAAVGVELEYEARWEGLPVPLAGHFAGPRREGEEMRFALPTLASFPVARGRLLDTEGLPVADRKITIHVSIATRGSSSGKGNELSTDGNGRFELPLIDELPKGATRVLTFTVAAAKQGEKELGEADASVELSKPLPPGPLELGEITLIPPGSLRWLARLSDDDLKKTFEARRGGAAKRTVDVEACLLEMARRKSERWKKLLADELAAARPKAAKKPKKGKEGDAAPPAETPHDLELLTALRRAQGKPDPLTIELDAKPPFDATFPATPSLRVRLRNVDKEAYGITDGGSYRSGRFARLHVEAVDQNGARAPVITSFGMGIGGGMFGRRLFEPKQWIDLDVDLGNYVRFPGPGDYQVRLSYHDDETIADVDRIEGYVVSESPAFLVRLRPRAIVVARATVEALRQEFLRIDAAKKVPLVSGHWRADLTFTGEAQSPEDRLFRAGDAAVPALLDLLDEPTLTVEQRSWLFGMLWNITGMNNPTTGEFFAAVKDPVWIGDWPGSTEASGTKWNEFGDHSGGGWPDHQKGLAERWKSMRSWFDLRIEK